ncbi:MAG: GGDEF domain-containing protein [Methylotenera sp.]
MPLSASILSDNLWNNLSLKFNNARLEAHYKKHIFPRLLTQSRLALLLIAMMYELYGVLDYLLAPQNLLGQIAVIRTTTTFIILVVFVLTFFKFFRKYNQLILTFALLLSGVSLIWKMTLIEQNLFPYYFTGLLLLLFWVHAFYVLNFACAFFCTFAILCISVISFFVFFSFSLNETVSYLIVLISAFGISIFSSYIAEKGDRSLFLREKELDRERHVHRKRAMHDELTSLPNRALLIDRIEQVILDSRRNNQFSAGFFLDLDNFKIINDTYGHAVGDGVLNEVSNRLTATIRAADTVARLSGDEFFVLARDLKNIKQAEAFGHKLLRRINQPYRIGGMLVSTSLSASIGICLFPYAGVTPLDMINKADQAMYQVKLSGKSGIAVAK